MVAILKISGTVKFGSKNIFSKRLKSTLKYKKFVLISIELSNKERRLTNRGPDFFQLTSNLITCEEYDRQLLTSNLNDTKVYKVLLKFQEGVYRDTFPLQQVLAADKYFEISNQNTSKVSICVSSLQSRDFNKFDFSVTLRFKN